MRHKAYLSLGANLGDRIDQIRQALNHLRAWGAIEQVSPCYETEPVGYEAQPEFLNLACLFSTGLGPNELLEKCKLVEKEMGRQASFRNAPRPIDIDILLFDDLILDAPELSIPHPRMSERAFVLAPMADIAPETIHPILRLTVLEMLDRVDRQGVKPFMQAEVVESFYLETQSGMFFAVKGLEHPPDRWIAVLRYAPDPERGERKKDGEIYRRLYHFADQEEFLREFHPQYLAFDPFFQTTLQSVPRSAVVRIHDPRLRLRELAQAPAEKSIEADAVAFARLLKEESGIPWSGLGISGSLLIGLHTKFSDLDISIFGEQNSNRVYRALQRILDAHSCVELDRLDEHGMDDLYAERSTDTHMDFQEFAEMERRKVNQGRFRERTYFIRFIKNTVDADEAYGQLRYTQVGRAEITASIADDREAIFTPCKYRISDVCSPEGRALTNLTEIVSFRGRFCEQARTGESVAASGVLEMVQSSGGRTWQRLLLGNSPEDKMVLRRAE
jgi:2-amino-4-hydroxy-6-hydroxymethyldihydropteridine diphosphokinase